MQIWMKMNRRQLQMDDFDSRRTAYDNNVDNGHDNHAVHTTADNLDYVASGYDTVNAMKDKVDPVPESEDVSEEGSADMRCTPDIPIKS